MPLRFSYVLSLRLLSEKSVQQSNTDLTIAYKAVLMDMMVMSAPHKDTTLIPKHRPFLLTSEAQNSMHAHPSHRSSTLEVLNTDTNAMSSILRSAMDYDFRKSCAPLHDDRLGMRTSFLTSRQYTSPVTLKMSTRRQASLSTYDFRFIAVRSALNTRTPP